MKKLLILSLITLTSVLSSKKPDTSEIKDLENASTSLHGIYQSMAHKMMEYQSLIETQPLSDETKTHIEQLSKYLNEQQQIIGQQMAKLDGIIDAKIEKLKKAGYTYSRVMP